MESQSDADWFVGRLARSFVPSFVAFLGRCSSPFASLTLRCLLWSRSIMTLVIIRMLPGYTEEDDRLVGLSRE